MDVAPAETRMRAEAMAGPGLSGWQRVLKRVAPLAVAVVLDWLWGEPPARLHPVVWMGHVLAGLEARAPRQATVRTLYGLGVAFALPLGWAWLGRRVEQLVPWPLHGLALKPTFAGRALLRAAADVEVTLRAGRLEAARRALGSLVSRPTDDLDTPLVAAAAVESLAENLVDSWLAPLLAYSLFGLGGAYAYRAANTADAMWGYRTPRYVRLGMAAARLDDAFNLLPARLGALCLACAAGARWRSAWRAWRTDGRCTRSPNAGQSMACAAGALDVRLEKLGEYVLNAAAPLPNATSITRARRLVRRSMGVSLGVVLLLRLAARD